MKKIPAILAVLASIPFFTLGIIYLVATATGVRGGLTAVALLAIGTALLIAGLRRLRRLARISPSALRTGAVELARRLGGDLTVSQFRAEYRIPLELAEETLEELASEGTCARERRDEHFIYVFAGLLPSLAEKVCPYCGTELPVRSALRKCPNCGAQLEVTKG